MNTVSTELTLLKAGYTRSEIKAMPYDDAKMYSYIIGALNG